MVEPASEERESLLGRYLLTVEDFFLLKKYECHEPLELQQPAVQAAYGRLVQRGLVAMLGEGLTLTEQGKDLLRRVEELDIPERLMPEDVRGLRNYFRLLRVIKYEDQIRVLSALGGPELASVIGV